MPASLLPTSLRSLLPSDEALLSFMVMGCLALCLLCCLAVCAVQSRREGRLKWYWRALTLLLGTGIGLSVAALEFIAPVGDSGEMPPLAGIGLRMTLLGAVCALPGMALLAWRKMRPPTAQSRKSATIARH